MASPEPGYMHYLAILKASYDYAPQSEDEVEIKEDQLLLLVERVDDDWWKVKIKGESQDDEGPVGLVPAAYVEQAEHTSFVKVLYDYDAAAEGELSVKEDDILRVFETEGDWILAQSQSEDAAGYVPGNYVEATSGEAAPEPVAAPIVVPESPARPLSNYEDPAVRVQTHKLSADDIKTWSVSELDKKGKKKKGTLGIGNGSLFFASESDKTAVQKWQTSDVIDASIDKPKHVLVELGGPNATSLHFHAGSKDNAEEILAKVHTSKAIATASSSPNDPSAPTVARRLPPIADSTPRAANKGVHFSESSPVIIPVAPRVEQEEEEEEEEEEASADGEVATALYDFKADGEDELSVSEGEQLLILERDGDEWWKCRNANGTEGVVPAQYLELQDGAGGVAATSSVAVSQEEEDDDAAEEEEANRLREQEQREAAEKQKREAEAAKARKQQAAQQKALAAEAERKRQLEAREKQIAAKPKSPTRSDTNDSSSSSTKPEPLSRPPPEKTRTWHDRSGQFRVDAAFLGFSNGKLRLHKTNGVVVEVPAEKMSSEDMRYVERLVKKQRAHSGMSDEDVPLAISAKVKNGSGSSSAATRVPPPQKKAPQIDWFDFFLGAGCDIDDCTRYAAAFERDKIDETILPDVTDSTMRSLGLKEGDIIRVKKAIEKRKPNENLNKPSPYIADQIRRDEELAKQLQAQESGGKPAPNLFAGPGGVLKAPRRGRPQPKGSLPLSNVDIKAIDSASDTIQRTGSPRSATPVSSTPSATNAVQAPPRSSSALAKPSSGFEDDAWTVRPSSTKPLVGTPPSATPRIPSAPPAEPTPAPPPPAAATPAPAPASQPAQTASPPNLAKTTESDIFDQLARLSALRVTSSPAPPPQQSTPQPLSATPSIQTPPSFQMGMGMSNSPLPLGHLQANAPSLSPSPQFNGPRGPYAPVPANQGLLQPLIPTQTGFNSFVPTRAPTMNAPPLPTMQNNMMQPNMNSLSPPPQLSPLMLQQTGMMLPQQTGMPMNGSGFVQGSPFNGGTPMHSFPNNSGFGGQTMQPLQPQFTSFNPSAGGNFNGNSFNGLASAAPAPQAPKDNTPANIFASMKSGTFEEDNNQNNNGPQHAGMYDALRVNPTPLQMQPTGWGQPQQNFGMGYR